MADLVRNAIYDYTNVEMPKDGAILGVQSEDAPSRLLDYYFDIITNHSLSIQNQITDNYLENNTAVQDHIAHAPLTITLSGLSGDVVYKSIDSEEDYQYQMQKAKLHTNTLGFIGIEEKLSTATVLLPEVNDVMQIVGNVYDYVSASIERYVGIVRSFLNSNDPIDQYTGVNQQHKNIRLREVYRKLQMLSDSNTSLWVHTPYGDFTDMYIQSITLRQDNTNFATDIEVALKQLRFAEVSITAPDTQTMSVLNAQARANAQNNGKTKGVHTSALKTIWTKGSIAPFLGE